MGRLLGRMFRVARTRAGAPILVHWTIPAIALFMPGAGVEHIATAAAAIAAYLTMLLVHELGHHAVALKRGCSVVRISIYPFHASCRYAGDPSRLDVALIAWGGPAAQMIVAAPLVTFVIVGGYLGFEPLNAVFAILGFFSAVLAILNLLPIRGLDGSVAWSALPLLWSRQRKEPVREPQTALEAMEEALRKARKRSGRRS